MLASLLRDPLVTRATLSRALEAYETIRLPQANHVQRGSRQSGIMYEFNSVLEDRYAELGQEIEHMWDWLWVRSPEEDVRRGLRLMKGNLSGHL